MISNSVLEPIARLEPIAPFQSTHWAFRARLLWQQRRTLARVTAISLLVSLAIAFGMPKRYRSKTSIMPPEQQSSSAMMLAALASRSPNLGSLGSLASSLMGTHSTTALFVDFLRSGTVSGHLINRFNLQHVYHKRYRIDTAKHLARCTEITDDKKSGIITIEVDDTNPVRARDLAQGYLDELNKLVTQTNTSSAHRERVFIEDRLRTVQAELEHAQIELSEFASKSSTIDVGAQTKAMVDAGARVQAQLLVEQSGLQSLRAIYGDGNIRVREAEARIAALQTGLKKITGSSAPLATGDVDESNFSPHMTDNDGEPYPPLRQLPRLAVPYADLYRRVKTEEAAFELLTQQYELARLEEARDVPSVSVIDPPGIPEKKYFPPRILLALLLTFLSVVTAAAVILTRDHWSKIDPRDPRKSLAIDVLAVTRHRIDSVLARRRGAA
jgi:capsule polysaccharide export protein KpsE/RkpR